MLPPLPIDPLLPELTTTLATHGRAVLQAPPGAGKTTRVPLALLPTEGARGRILMLEPRRLAARAAAERMAETLGEPVGQTVGYRVRGEAKVSGKTRIEVVTEGILTRMIQSDPGLSGISAVIFDEFHERSLNADLGLALTWEVRGALREDLILVVMSATLDAEPVAAMLDAAPIIRSDGRAFPVETRWLLRPPTTGLRPATIAASLVIEAVENTQGGVLVFLPGEGEIMRVAGLLRDRLPADCDIRPLYGAMEFAAQRAALAPAPTGRRKIVLATAIAETSLTIPDIRVVVDGGLARRARFDPGSGMARLVTERVTKAEAEQRRGRAGRVAEGICYRMWTKGEEGGMQPFPPPEIAATDLTGLALELALWGAQAGDLAFLTPPPPAALAEAQALLAELGALDDAGHITGHGRRPAALPLHPRIGHMLVTAGPAAATLAALLEERDPIRGAPVGLDLRLLAIRDPKTYEADHPHPLNRATVERIRTEAKRLARMVDPVGDTFTPAEMAALAYPDRIGLRRPGDTARYVLSGGKGAVIDMGDPLARAEIIVATDLDGDPREARVRQGAELSETSLRRLYGHKITRQDVCEWSRRDGRVIARRQERLGALILADAPLATPDPAAVARAAFDGLRIIGLPWTEPARRFRARINLMRQEGMDLPDLSDDALLADPDWLLPALAGKRTEAQLRALDLTEALKARLSWASQQEIDRLAPAYFETPLGRRVPIDYDGDYHGISLRIQEVFGVTEHPVIGPKRLPLRLTLLSPGQKPIQVTTDLPRFWATSYADVRKDMRGQYPRHPWPEDPRQAEPTLRAKPRGT